MKSGLVLQCDEAFDDDEGFTCAVVGFLPGEITTASSYRPFLNPGAFLLLTGVEPRRPTVGVRDECDYNARR